jgi:hypothetical protein
VTVDVLVDIDVGTRTGISPAAGAGLARQIVASRPCACGACRATQDTVLT